MIKEVPTNDVDVKEVTDDCGCAWIVRTLGSKNMSQIFRRLQTHNGVPMRCAAHAKQENDASIREAKEERVRFRRRIPLSCDKCDEYMGMVFEGDLNGSRFYCIQCSDYE